jgi:UTP-glucose-1-phosphate uridylyltransferase
LQAGFGKIVFVIRKDIEAAFMEKIGNKIAEVAEIDFVYQEYDTPITGVDAFPAREKPWGTGHAILVAYETIKEPFAVINADDYYGVDGFRSMARFLTSDCEPEHFCMIGYVLANTLSENGFVSRGVCEVDADFKLLSVTERTKIGREADGQICYEEAGQKVALPDETYVSMNFWGFHASIFESLRKDFVQFVQDNWENPKAEFYIPTAVNNMMNHQGLKVSLLPSQDLWYGVTYQEDRGTVSRAFQQFIAEGRYPEQLWA